MKKLLLFSTLLSLLWMSAFSQSAIKNVIFMVPDGTSVGVLSLARWYQYYNDTSQTRLAVDQYICGLVKNHSSNAPIGDSAPTMSWYMTGYPSQTRFISMCPPQSANDLLFVDSALNYTPRMTIMEAVRIARNKAVGLVFTCEFTHATPAATSAHWYSRSDYPIIQQQMIHNNIDVLIGGGAKLMSELDVLTHHKKGYSIFNNDLEGFRYAKRKKLWALFGDNGKYGYMDNDWDRDPSKQPSLAEMTKKAIKLLSENKDKEGFFLMVEGSKIDWAAHSNNPGGVLSEYLAFDAAVKEAISFAQANGETLVVICPDHGTGGISIGNKRSNLGYDKLTLNDIIEPLKNNRKAKSYVGFSTRGHTGEDLFLAIYDPRHNPRPTGLVTPKEISNYLCEAMDIKSLDSLSNIYYAKATDLFDEKDFLFDTLDEKRLKITQRNHPNTSIIIEAHSNYVIINKIEWQTKTPAIYVDKTKTWFISQECLLFLSLLL